jgi:hypothetical protein
MAQTGILRSSHDRSRVSPFAFRKYESKEAFASKSHQIIQILG